MVLHARPDSDIEVRDRTEATKMSQEEAIVDGQIFNAGQGILGECDLVLVRWAVDVEIKERDLRLQGEEDKQVFVASHMVQLERLQLEATRVESGQHWLVHRAAVVTTGSIKTQVRQLAEFREYLVQRRDGKFDVSIV